MVDVTFLNTCLSTLEKAYNALTQSSPQDGLYEIYRAACVKEFELVLEQSGKLLRKRLHPYFANNKEVDRLTFKDVFRFGAKHGVLEASACERWLSYRDSRNATAHDYGESFAENTLRLLPVFIQDAKALSAVIASGPDV